MSGRGRRRARRGFSLIELMVALAVGGVTITTIYAIAASATRVFHQQHQSASTQTAVRLTINQLRRDIARAGFLSTPNLGIPGQSCIPVNANVHAPLGAGPVAAIANFRNDVDTSAGSGRDAADPTGNNRVNGFSVDEITLTGNYETSSEYIGARVALNNPSSIFVSRNWYAFHRDFNNWYTDVPPLALDEPAFRRAFAVGRMVRLRTPTGRYHFAVVRAVTPDPAAVNDPQISIDVAVPGDCATAAATNGAVAPVNTIRYYVRNVDASELRPGALQATGPMAQLIREEVQPGNKVTPLFAVDAEGRGPGTRAVLDYVVGFNLEFTSTAQTPPNSPDAYAPGVSLPQAPDNDATPPTVADNDAAAADINRFPELIRAAVIDVAVRTPEQSATFPFVNCQRMRCFQVFPASGAGGRPGAARVRRMRAEVFLPNIAGEGY